MSEPRNDPFVRGVLDRLDPTPRRRRRLDRDARRAIVAFLVLGVIALVWSLRPTTPEVSTDASPSGIASDRDLAAVWNRLRMPESRSPSDETSNAPPR